MKTEYLVSSHRASFMILGLSALNRASLRTMAYWFSSLRTRKTFLNLGSPHSLCFLNLEVTFSVLKSSI